MTIRVGIADDQALVRSGFRLILDARPDIEVVGEAEDGAGAIKLVEDHGPDVLLLDIRMPNMDGIEATRRIVALGSQTRILILTTFDLDEYVHQAVRAGASGFLLKDVRPNDLEDAIRVVAGGNALLAPSALTQLLTRYDAKPAAPVNLERLTGRETEILSLLAGGNSNAEIARALIVSEATVKTHTCRTSSANLPSVTASKPSSQPTTPDSSNPAPIPASRAPAPHSSPIGRGPSVGRSVGRTANQAAVQASAVQAPRAAPLDPARLRLPAQRLACPSSRMDVSDAVRAATWLRSGELSHR